MEEADSRTPSRILGPSHLLVDTQEREFVANYASAFTFEKVAYSFEGCM